MKVIARPIIPKLLAQLDDRAAAVTRELELSDCSVTDTDFSGIRRLEVEGCRLTAVQFSSAVFDKLSLSDVIANRLEAAGMHAPEAALLRVMMKDSRLTGIDLGASLLEDCTFENVKLDESGSRFATFKRVRFENCNLRNADFSGAKLMHVSFSGCELEGANFDNAACKLVDFRGENLSTIKGALGLKGATISSEQLIQLAPLLAAEAGLDVDYET